MARAVPSFGARMKTLPLSAAVATVRLASARFLATSKFPFGGDLANDLGFFVAGQGGLVLEGNSFAGVLDDEGAVGDLGLQNSPGAFEEQEGVVVGGSAGIQVQRVAFAGGFVNQVLALGFTNGNAVEGHIVIDCVGVADQAVIGNDLDAGLVGFFSGSGGSGAVLRADDDDFDALGDQSFNVGFFLGGIALAEENLDGEISVLRASLKRVSSCIQRGSSLVGRTIPMDILPPAAVPAGAHARQ